MVAIRGSCAESCAKPYVKKSYAEVIRRVVFPRGFATTCESYVKVIRRKTEKFFRYIAIRGPYGNPYTVVMRRGHT